MKPKAAKADPKKALTLVCDACGYENEPQRIYCHNCAAKLDRSKLPAESEQKASGIDDYKKRQNQQLVAQRMKKLGINLIRTPLLAAATASLVLIFKPPGNLPEIPSQDEMLDAPMVGVDLQGILVSPVKAQLVYSEKQINGFLARAIRPDKNASSYVVLERTMAGFEPGEVRILMTIKVVTVPITAQTKRAVSVKNGKLSDEVTGLQLGSLPIHPMASVAMNQIFGKLWTALNQEKKLVERLDSLKVEEKRVIMVGGARLGGE